MPKPMKKQSRPIKFRAWDTEKKCFANLGTYESNWDLTFIHQSPPLIQLDGWTHLVFQQFTGLHDRNGKEIYEGDVVRFVFEASGTFEKPIVWHEGVAGFVAYPVEDEQINYLENSNCEVVGNIYENPELVSP